MRYLRLKSLAWWAGIGMVGLGVLMIACTTCDMGEIAGAVSVLAGSGDASPGGLILFGLGLIGLRDKLERI